MGKCSKDLTKGDCVLGEHYARYVLGLGVNKYDDASKEQVVAARDYYAKNLGIIVATNDDLNALRESPDAYYKKVMTWNKDVVNLVPRINVERAHVLMKSLGYDMAPGSWKPRIDGYLSYGVQTSTPAVNSTTPADTSAAKDIVSNTDPAASGSVPPVAPPAPSIWSKYKWPIIIIGGLIVITTIIVIVKKSK